MNKREIIDFFLKRGVLLSPEELEGTNKENYMKILEKKRGKQKDEKGEDFVVEEPKKGKISAEDFIKTYNKKFEFLKEKLLKKTEAVSINKGKKIFSKVTIIGRVKETTPKGFVLEDVTGETEVVEEKEKPNTGDVLGAKGFFKENSFFPEQIIWPDIPLDNNPDTIKKPLTLTTKVKENMNGLIICPKAEGKDSVITGFDGLGKIKISNEGKEIIVLAYSPGERFDEEEAVKVLKRRIVPEDEILDNLITEIPDIFWLFDNEKNWTRNYRGVIIISTSKSSFAEYEKGNIKFEKI